MTAASAWDTRRLNRIHRPLSDETAIQLRGPQTLVGELQHKSDSVIAEPALVAVGKYLQELHPLFTVDLFVRGDDGFRGCLLTADGELRRETLDD